MDALTVPKLEREVKLAAPEAFSLARLDPQLGGYIAAPVAYHRLHTTYFDSDDLRLTRWGCSLRFRLGEGWTLKLPAGQDAAALARTEHVFPGDAARVPAGALALATPYLRGAVPHPVAELRTLRVSRQVRDDTGDALADVVEDDVRVVEGHRIVRRFRQVEIELADAADDDVLDGLTALLREAGAGEPDPTPKNVLALGAAARAPELQAPALDDDACGGDLARAALVAAVETLVRSDAPLRLAPGADAVHDARVATRRLRSHLRTFLPVLDPDWARGLRERLRGLADGIGAARDADVLLARLERRAQTLPATDQGGAQTLLLRFRAERDEAYTRMHALLRDPDYVRLLDEAIAAAAQPRFSPAAAAPAVEIVPAVVRDAWKSLRKPVRRRGRPPSDRELHGIRIKAKRLRYAAEAVAAAGDSHAARIARRAQALQDVLGEQHDAVVVCERLRERAGERETAFVAGEIVALETETARACRAAWRRAWRRLRVAMG